MPTRSPSGNLEQEATEQSAQSRGESKDKQDLNLS